jgi:cysteinyl-tRNA synthetase
MAEAFTGVRPYARAWLHAGVVTTGGEKMAKSAGNLVLAGDLLRDYPAAAIRLMILDRHWARDWDYAPALADSAAGRLESLHRSADRPGSGHADVAEVRRLLTEDLDVPAALDLAIEAGGAPARLLTAVLGLS